MRWNATITLHSNPERYQDEEGAWHEGDTTPRTIFCNEMKYGSMFMSNLRSNDVRALNNNIRVDVAQMPEAQIQVRESEYHGEHTCTFKGDEYIVLYRTRAGEFSILGIARRLGNA